MRGLFRRTALAVGIIAISSGARAEGFSTSAISPTPVAATGLIAGSYPASDAETSYYFAVDLMQGERRAAGDLQVADRCGRAHVARMERLRNPGPPLPHSASAPCGLHE
jgi:hypothetical protein